jgi:acyl carrier protein
MMKFELHNLKKYIAEKFGVSVQNIGLFSSLKEDIGLDKEQVLLLIRYTERFFGIRLNPKVYLEKFEFMMDLIYSVQLKKYQEGSLSTLPIN